MSEHILVVIERNVSPEQTRVVKGVVDFLWTDQAQKLFVDTGFRSVDASLNARNPVFGKIQDPFLVDELGGWQRAERDIVNRLWKNQVLKELGRRP